jgi:hypothetical protein
MSCREVKQFDFMGFELENLNAQDTVLLCSSFE